MNFKTTLMQLIWQIFRRWILNFSSKKIRNKYSYFITKELMQVIVDALVLCQSIVKLLKYATNKNKHEGFSQFNQPCTHKLFKNIMEKSAKIDFYYWGKILVSQPTKTFIFFKNAKIFLNFIFSISCLFIKNWNYAEI